MRRLLPMIALIAVAALAAASPAHAQSGPAAQPQLSAQDRADVARVEQYFNSIKSFQARFNQVSSIGGKQIAGNFYVRRPGRLRFEYDPPAKVVIVSDGAQVTYYDAARDELSQVPLGWSVANFLVQENLKLSGDLTVTRVDRADGLLQLTIIQTKSPQEGKLLLVVTEQPMQLKRWSVIDAKEREIMITLSDMKTGVNLKNDLFYVDIDPNKANRPRP